MTGVRKAVASDIDELLRLEGLAFRGDRLSRRSFKRWLKHPGCVFLVSEENGVLCGYILVILRRGTRLARLYSLAVDPACRGRGIASSLIELAEQRAREEGSLYMRLEVAGNNDAAIKLYRRLGYSQFGMYQDYYEDHSDALRMEKCVHRLTPANDHRRIPWISQTTTFTCGPASLMMAMNGLDPDYSPSPLEEVQIWREATTIFMTSGHGGCHPVGLALAAASRGFEAEVWISNRGPLFVDGVRDPNKKRVMGLVHESFLEQAKKLKLPVRYADIDQAKLADCYARGDNVLILISTYRLDNRKAPHWVVLSGYDEHCLYFHDPDLEMGPYETIADENRDSIECQHVPIARQDFASMSLFGSRRLRTAVILRKP
ncbi:MAG: GNAT family N-acetyltransferase/peptidase C39 family protein [Pseudomonadales bacterium]|nr:GNAT family N-acetyltransferase/peptidase C39 family protein [Halioglobus sp.]MCP5130026.1 GNAT family N-acetyltransferase/peptidase C39 family protein [Pseudomonadales bacterium]